jgi:hypothetical protein
MGWSFRFYLEMNQWNVQAAVCSYFDLENVDSNIPGRSGLAFPPPCRQRIVADPDPPDPHVFGPLGSGFISQEYGSRSFHHNAKVVRKTLIPTIL